MIVIIIINIIEYSYSYYLIFFLETLFLDNSILKFRLIDHFTVVADTTTFTLERNIRNSVFLKS